MPTSSRSLATPPPIFYRTKQELVYRTLRDAILTCELAPDQRLVIDDIARRLSVSTIPVREALQMLQSEGLVTMVPHVGAAVASLSRESVVDVFSVLEGLQVVAGRLAATDASAEELQALSGMVGEMDQAIEGGLYEHVGGFEYPIPRRDRRDPGADAPAPKQRAGAGSLGSRATLLLQRRALTPRRPGPA